MSLDLAYDDGQSAVAEAVGQFCTEHVSDAVVRGALNNFDKSLWRHFSELGVFLAAEPGGEAGAIELCAAMEVLGDANFPGPLVSTCVAVHALPEAERAGLLDGTEVAALGEPPVLGWAEVADVFLIHKEGRLYRAERRGEVEPLETLGGESWGRVDLEAGEALSRSAAALNLGEMALASYLVGAGRRIIREAAEHAATRQQFGRPIGEFQAVSHPLADSWMRLDAARGLARRAAWAFERADPQETQYRAAVARRSATRAAVEAAHVAHQVFGAVGVTLEGPAFPVSRRIRQWASQASSWSNSQDPILDAWEVRAAQGVNPWDVEKRRSDARK